MINDQFPRVEKIVLRPAGPEGCRSLEFVLTTGAVIASFMVDNDMLVDIGGICIKAIDYPGEVIEKKFKLHRIIEGGSPRLETTSSKTTGETSLTTNLSLPSNKHEIF